MSKLRLEPNLVSRPLPEVRARVEGSVCTLDWRIESERATACNFLELHASGSQSAPKAPFLIKHAVSQWPALQKWDLEFFLHYCPRLRVFVRVSPSMKFFFVTEKLLPLWEKLRFLHGQKLPPSVVVPMTMQEFVQRMQADCQLGNVAYPEESSQEFYYMQSILPPGLVRDVDLYSPPLSCLGKPGITGPAGEVAEEPSGMHIAQAPKIYLSPAGAISPLHFDTASSFLTQIKGRKRLLFWKPEDLKSLYTYNRLHILRRRSKIDLTCPDLKKFPKFEALTATEAVLEPGDVLWFPGYWSHYTESVDMSISMTYRFWSELQVQQQSQGLFRLLKL